jgi:hypothetical protein
MLKYNIVFTTTGMGAARIFSGWGQPIVQGGGVRKFADKVTFKQFKTILLI